MPIDGFGKEPSYYDIEVLLLSCYTDARKSATKCRITLEFTSAANTTEQSPLQCTMPMAQVMKTRQEHAVHMPKHVHPRASLSPRGRYRCCGPDLRGT